MEGKSPLPFAPSAPPAKSAFEIFQAFCDANEISKKDCINLYNDLADVRIGILVDDSASMNRKIVPEGTNAFLAPVVTRWSEATNDVASILNIVLAMKPSEGIDLYFMNRPGPTRRVSNLSEIASYFNAPPSESTPMLRTLRNIFSSANVSSSGRYLLVIITDGQPNDGYPEEASIEQLKDLLMRKPSNLYVSMVECSDCAEEMDYLESWNSIIPQFDNTEDYPEELRRIRTIQRNQSFKFTRMDYVIKILLATLNRAYFNVDMVAMGSSSSSTTTTYVSSSTPATYATYAASSSAPATYTLPPPSTTYAQNSDCCCVML